MDIDKAPSVHVIHAEGSSVFPRSLGDLLGTGAFAVIAIDDGSMVREYQAGTWQTAELLSADGTVQQRFSPHQPLMRACAHCGTPVYSDVPPKQPMTIQLCDSCWSDAVNTQVRKADRGAA